MEAQRHELPHKTITSDEVNLLPLKTFDGKIKVVSTPDAVASVFQEVNDHPLVGFDTETRPSFHKGQFYKVALMQLAIPGKAFLIRLHHTGITDEILEFLENANILKSGVGIRDDIQALRKIHAFTPQGFVELSSLAKEAGLEVESVKKLTALLLGFRISKSAQTSNWEAMTLTQKQIEYAATDAWVCLELYRRLQGIRP